MGSFYNGDKLSTGADATAHFLQMRNIMGTNDRFLYSSTYGVGAGEAGADVPAMVDLQGQLDERAGGKAAKFLLTTIENDLMADAARRNGAEKTDEQQMQVQQFAVPDTAEKVYRPYASCTVADLENFFKRKVMEGATIDTLVTEFEGKEFVPGTDLAEWFDDRVREYVPMQGEVSQREFIQMLVDLLPDGDVLHPKLMPPHMNRPPESLQEALEDAGSVSNSKAKAILIDTQRKLQKAAKKVKNQRQQWWPDLKAKKKSSEIHAVSTALESRIMELEKMAIVPAQSTNPFVVPVAAVGAQSPAKPETLEQAQQRIQQLESQLQGTNQNQNANQNNQNQQQPQQNQNQQWGQAPWQGQQQQS